MSIRYCLYRVTIDLAGGLVGLLYLIFVLVGNFLVPFAFGPLKEGDERQATNNKYDGYDFLYFIVVLHD